MQHTIALGNRLLAALPKADVESLGPLRRVPLERDAVLVQPGYPAQQIHFPCSGMVTLMIEMPNGQVAATAVTGNDGISGVLLSLGPVPSPITAVVRAVCNALHSVDERMATWLLRMHDRVEGDVLPVTQDAIAELLGVRRTTVTLAALKLTEAGAIRSHGRGSIKIDRKRLEAASCQCYELMSHRINGIVSQHGIKISQSPRADWLG